VAFQLVIQRVLVTNGLETDAYCICQAYELYGALNCAANGLDVSRGNVVLRWALFFSQSNPILKLLDRYDVSKRRHGF
jgi:hypothetical protein